MKKGKKNMDLPVISKDKPYKVMTYAGKYTARVTKIYKQMDGSIIKATRKINKDGSISDRVELRHM